MALNWTTLGWFFSLLLWVSANSNAGTDRAKQRENQLKLLEEYEAFEAQVNDTITSIFKKLHQEDNCPEDDKGGTGACRKPSPVSLEDFELDLNSLLDRTENVEAVILELLPGRNSFCLRSDTRLSLRKYEMKLLCSCDHIAGIRRGCCQLVRSNRVVNTERIRGSLL